MIYRTSGANIKSVTISINKEGSNDISYAPFALFGGSTFLTGTIGKINAVIIIYYENIKNAIVKEE